MPNKTAVFPGSFDPFTLGHFDIVVRSLKLFDEVIIAIGHNSQKKRYFPLETMLSKIESAFVKYPQVKIVTYDELTADLAKRLGAKVLLRGLRNTTDFEYENSISQVNRYLNDEIETMFLITSPKYAPISSTIIREVHKYGGDVKAFLPYEL
ncbi:MAG: pantetheine-phosphate adenylyltransferase [Imperialibacter sp.]|jgi:pantetheine-phosphate adenylyltransferase|uniref:pantetheine-phosphate adenylyltransferase n=1 Tax=unclassified Imperialibacter TaxID=2629706 RepID=UPI0012590976|nr:MULTISPECIES: pantetheine-phosphate adenylyltransferase [unclassified Imperialibacter]CAD5280821.1 Phosphopantetheine adenylyltransferase [Imperialibacter sp. 75]CAD5284293.1 Phosphopantetheine adenylyltransferase [Imperialibacter sp. 89]VVT28464.1 Phosphopantetheine adenylyltransferase [Imperialibacter sp. EC-SDR9]|tara:strand:- start:1114 stop:1569 length:456 start_codon:yes stop_codon:yes gene_type:complete